ncbi:ABC transporter ATP-binding protein [Meridianimarinicoccus aquatilis]|uniref:ABC transporter ATP-binding protein n=1 Tax=Meridianimarinicoccus aquatilis TaxID=2552766 RepID=A0A4R6AJR6_9RHOB|nr:ABC transporter ATP-binding protein [Fluviibacterium aquatile]TDL83787.1 ABC transporter ATP-binding protein [Fluviibacterium aquatile]
MTLPLHVRDCVVRNRGGRVLLNVPNLELTPGASLGIRGPSGAGKSTLLYALAGLLEGINGEVHWGDTDLLTLSSARRASFRAANIGMIFQDFLLFEELDAASNAGLAAMYLPKAQRAGVKACAMAQLAHLGLDASARSVASYSGGERQRVAIARALANEATILLADEPTASLDRPAADSLIEGLVNRVRDQGATLIAVSHDAHLLDRMDRVLGLEDGQVTAGALP